MLLQKAWFLHGLINYIASQDTDNKSLKETERDKLLQSSLRYLSESYDLNSHMKTNLIKNIYILIVKSQCEYANNEYQKALHQIQEAFVQLINFNNYTKNINEKMNDGIMVSLNGLLLHIIFFYLGKYLIITGTRKLGCEVLIKSMEISMFKSEVIISMSASLIDKCLNDKSLNEKRLLTNIHQRLHPLKSIHRTKGLVIVTSNNFYETYSCSGELKIALEKYLRKYFNPEKDGIGFIEVGSIYSIINPLYKINKFWAEFDRAHSKDLQFTQGNHPNNLPGEDVDDELESYYDLQIKCKMINHDQNMSFGLKKAIEMLKYKSRSYDDKIIFLFGLSKWVDFTSDREYNQLRKTMSEENISLYVFCFDENILINNSESIINYLRYQNMIEGILIKVVSFKIIKHVLQNMTTLSKHKKIMKLYTNFNTNIW